MQIPFYRVYLAEWQKTKFSWGLTLSILGPLAVSLIIILGFIQNADKADNATNPWGDFAQITFQFYFLLYPLFAALAAFLLCNIEHKNQGFKFIFTQAAPKYHFYLSKVLILWTWITCSFLTAAVLLIVGGNLLGVIVPAYGFQEYTPNVITWIFLVRLYISLMGILAIHFFLSLYFDNFIISIGAAVFLFVFGMSVFNQWDYDYLVPYTYPIQHFVEFRSGEGEWFSRETWISLIYMFVFLSGGYFLMK